MSLLCLIRAKRIKSRFSANRRSSLGLFDSQTSFPVVSAKFQLRIVDNDSLKLKLSPVTAQIADNLPHGDIFYRPAVISTVIARNRVLRYCEFSRKTFVVKDAAPYCSSDVLSQGLFFYKVDRFRSHCNV